MSPFPPSATGGADRLGAAITELGQAFEDRFAELTQLSRIAEDVHSALLLDDALDQLYESFREFVPYDRIGCALLSHDGQRLVTRWVRTDTTPCLPIDFSLPLSETSLARTLETGRPRIIDDLEDYCRHRPQSRASALLVQEGMRSSLSCPLRALGRPTGFLFFSSRQTYAYRNAHVDRFLQIANHVAVMVEKGRLHEERLAVERLRDQFVRTVVHDLRNPIGVVQGYARMFQGGFLGSLSAEQQGVMASIVHTCQGTLRLLDDLLDAEALREGHLKLDLELVAPAAYLDSYADAAAMLGRAGGVSVHVEVEPDLPPVHLDRGRIQQVLGNLVANAVKFSRSGGRITICAQRRGEDLEIAVRDQGCGIPGEELPHLFQEFARTSTSPPGGAKSTGLGLAIVKRLVELHGGTVRIESAPGVGTSVAFTLPFVR